MNKISLDFKKWTQRKLNTKSLVPQKCHEEQYELTKSPSSQFSQGSSSGEGISIHVRILARILKKISAKKYE
jgi:hypothetical protein